MTQEFAYFYEDRPPWITEDTALLAACVKDIADFIDFDIGNAMDSKYNGDSLWYVLTNKEGDSLLILMCTPHAIFIETTWLSDDIEYSMVDKPLKYLEYLHNSGLRKLTKDELDIFLEGLF